MSHRIVPAFAAQPYFERRDPEAQNSSVLRNHQEFLMTDLHTERDLKGIAAAQPAPAVAPKDEAFAAFEDALEDLVQFTAEDAISSCEALPNGRGCRGPDTSTADRLYAVVMEKARQAFAPKPAEPIHPPPAVDNGLTTVRGITARCGSLW